MSYSEAPLLMVTFRVKRFNPELDTSPHYEDYRVEADEMMTVLDGLEKIKEEVDGSLTMRHSCRQAICGACAARINGFTRLTCTTLVKDEVRRHGDVIYVEPMMNVAVEKDLVVDLQPFWTRLTGFKPWIIRDVSRPLPEEEHLVSREQMRRLMGAPNCIVCACCDSECPASHVDEDFPGPAALTKLYRFAVDPRDNGGLERLKNVTLSGLWWCVRCYICVEACPKEVRPGEVITFLRELAYRKAGVIESGGRHAEALRVNIRKYGILNEGRLALDSVGARRIFRRLRLAMRMARRGKLPSVPQKPMKLIDDVKRIYEEIESFR